MSDDKDLNQPATKADLQELRKATKADLKEFATKTDVQLAVQTAIQPMALKMINLENRLERVEENMMTKADKNEINNRFDAVMGQLVQINNSILIRGEWKEDHDKQLANHEQRLVNLESN